MKILLFGPNGQLGYELAKVLPELGELVAVDRSMMDLSQIEKLPTFIERVAPDIIVNATAYTAVDRAEEEVALAMNINVEAPKIMADYLRKTKGLLVHYSTDYVFPGTKGEPYLERDEKAPVNQYGLSKSKGEDAIQDSDVGHFILRTSWVYANRGKNFIKTMFRLAQEREQLKVVGDQFSAPTWAGSLAQMSCKLLKLAIEKHAVDKEWPKGLYHACSADHTNWHGLAFESLSLLRPKYGANWSLKSEECIGSIKTTEYPLPATRPLDTRMSPALLEKDWGLSMPDWKTQLAECLESWEE